MRAMSDAFWNGKVVVITGASAGIGEALAIELGKRGAKLVLAARRGPLLEEVAKKAGVDCERVVADVTVRAEVAKIAEKGIARFGKIDVWINNAGRAIVKKVEELTDDDLDTMMTDNVKSALYGAQAILPHMKARNEGHIANVSSMLSRTPFASIRSAYSAAKHALNSLTDNLRGDLAGTGIKVVLLLPGVVATDFGKNALGKGGPDNRAIPGAQSAEEVAKIFADGIAEGRAEVYTRPEFLDRVLGYYRELEAKRI
jgi:NADP-dependent 3-hydroxy acid dehydrogenase YdfG